MAGKKTAPAKAGGPSLEELQAELDRLRAENAGMREAKGRLQVSVKGAISLYGLRRFPVTYYADEWEAIFAARDRIVAFIEENSSKLKRKGGED